MANILGLSNLLEGEIESPEELKKILDYMKTSAQALDSFTTELTKFIHKTKLKVRKKSKAYSL